MGLSAVFAGQASAAPESLPLQCDFTFISLRWNHGCALRATALFSNEATACTCLSPFCP